ncbi:ABC transporter permease subunit, partial [Rhizobium leguminosarum]
FLEQLWIARYVIMNGIGVTVSISLLAILAGSILGVFVGLALVYGGVVLRLAVRAYTDIIRGTPVLVLVLASYYVSAAVGL